MNNERIIEKLPIKEIEYIRVKTGPQLRFAWIIYKLRDIIIVE